MIVEFFKKHLTKIVVGLLCIFFIVGVGIGAKQVMKMEGTYEPYEPVRSATKLNDIPDEETFNSLSDDEIQKYISYINTIVANAKDIKAEISNSADVSVDLSSISNNTAPEITAVATYISEKFEDKAAEKNTTVSAGFGEDIGDELAPLTLDRSDITNLTYVSHRYVCTVCSSGYDINDLPEVCAECDSENSFELRFRDNADIVITVNPDSTMLSKLFELRSGEDIADILNENSNGFYTATAENEYNSAKIYVSVNRITDEINSVRFVTDASCKAKLSFCADYENLGNAEINFDFSDKNSYSFRFAGIALNKNELVLAPKAQELLKATLTCDDPAKHYTTWTSSDPNVAKVDDDGYVTAGKVPGECEIIAEFEFNGEIYTETCIVKVRNTVESIDIHKRSLKMTVGEEFNNSFSLKPNNATVTTAKWYTSDETVATVDSDGKITAVGEGAADVFAVSDDGHFKATCKVEVTK